MLPNPLLVAPETLRRHLFTARKHAIHIAAIFGGGRAQFWSRSGSQAVSTTLANGEATHDIASEEAGPEGWRAPGQTPELSCAGGHPGLKDGYPRTRADGVLLRQGR